MARSKYRPLRKRKKPWIRRILFWFAGTVVVLIVALVIATPWILRAAVPEAFARIGMQASVTGGSLRPLRREVTLEGLIVGAPEAPALSLGELGIGLELRALIQGRIKLRRLRVKNVRVNAERLLALHKPGGPQPGSGQKRLPVELDAIELEDVRLVSLTERIGHDVRIKRLAISDLSALLVDRKSNLDLQGAIGDGSIALQLEVGLHEGNLRATGKFKIDQLPAHGWAGLTSRDADPVSAGVVNGRGDIRLGYVLETRNLDTSLEGRVSLAGLGVDIEPLKAEGDNADWQGRLALRWAPELAAPKLRGDGTLEVETLRVLLARASQAPVRAAISDLSWHGDFDWQDGFTSQGAFLGSSGEVSDASSTEATWQSHAEEFSWRLDTRIEGDAGKFVARIQDFDLERLTVTLTDADAHLDIAAENLAVDEIRAAQSGDLLLGSASVDTLTVAGRDGANSADAAKLRIGRLAAKGLNGDFSGNFQVASVSAESFEFAESGRRVRAEEIDLAGVGFRLPARMGADELNVKSMQGGRGQGDIWLSGLKATRFHGDAGGSFGAEAIDVTHVFQSATSKLSWDASDLKFRGIHGDTNNAAQVSAIELGALKIGIDETTWESSGLHTADVTVSRRGTLNAASLGLAKLERRQPSAGDLSITALDARGFRLLGARAELDGVTAATLEFNRPGGDAFQVDTLEARELGADPSKGIAISRLSVAGGAAQLVAGARLSGAALEASGLSVASNGSVALEQAQLRRFTHAGADSAILDLERLNFAASRWAPGGRLSVTRAALDGARFAGAEGPGWQLAKLDTSTLHWDGGERISAQAATLASVSQVHGQSRDWRAQMLRATGFRLALPRDIAIATLSAESVHGGDGSLVWNAGSINARGLGSSEADGQKADMLESGAVTVTDARNGAALGLERAEIQAARVSTLKALSAEQLLVDRLRLRSDKPDWPARLTVAELQVANPMLRSDGAVDLGSVVARNPYLIVAQTEDNAWMLPPLPGGDSGAQGANSAGSNGGIRVASFISRGTGRIAYIDRGTDPAFHLVVDPLVVALQDLDTRLPGNVSHFRARGTGPRFSGLRLHGELRKRVEGFDLGLNVSVKGAALPELNPYSRRQAFVSTAGRGDFHIESKIEDDELSGKVDVLLSGVEVKSTTGGGVITSNNSGIIPVATALTLLKDHKGNISLSIPLRAGTEDPKYDFADVFQVAFVSTVTTAGKLAVNLSGRSLDGALQLLGKTISLLPGVSAERYPPVEFAYGADDLSAEPLVYLDQLGARMRKGESMVLALCGRSVSEDEVTASGQSSGIDRLFAEASKGVYHSYEPGSDGLLALAEARAEMVRRYLHDVHRIPVRRLLSCDAHIDADAGARPRVDLQVKTPAESKGLFRLFF